MCLMLVYVCFVYVCKVIAFVDWLDKGFIYNIYEKSFEMCICLWPEYDCPEVTLCGWQDIKIQLLTNFELGWMMMMMSIFIVLDSVILNAQCFEGDWKYLKNIFI